MNRSIERGKILRKTETEKRETERQTDRQTDRELDRLSRTQ